MRLEQTAARPTTAIRSDSDEEREAARPDVRLFVILLDDYHVRRGNDMAVRKPLHRLHPEPARAGRHGGDHVSADAGHRHPLHAQPERADPAPSRTSRGASSITSRATSSRSSTPTTRRDGRADPQPGHDGRAQGGGGAAGRPARGAQVDHLRQRGLHHHAAAAAERSGRGDARRRQPGVAAADPADADDRRWRASAPTSSTRRTC